MSIAEHLLTRYVLVLSRGHGGDNNALSRPGSLESRSKLRRCGTSIRFSSNLSMYTNVVVCYLIFKY